MKYTFKTLAIVFFLFTGLTTACSDYLDPTLAQNKDLSSIETVDDLDGLMIGAYSRIKAVNVYGRDYIILGDVRTGNAFSNGNSGRFIEQSKLQVTENGSGGIWNAIYETIANCNLVIDSALSESRVDQIKGEAYALRALSHMILLKMYGEKFVSGSNKGIPYITTFNKEENFSPSRLSVEESESKIKADFKKALTLMDPSIHNDSKRLNYYSAEALLSRFYLFTEDYKNAATTAKDVIDSKEYTLASVSGYVSAWAEGQPAVLFEIAFNSADNPDRNSLFNMLQGGYGDVEVTQKLYQLYGSNDVRKDLYDTNTTDTDKKRERDVYRVTGKFTSLSSNVPVIRYAEVILTYAEAEFRRTDKPDPGKALLYLNKLASHRYKDGFNYTTAKLEDILKERRKELAMEGLYYWQLLRNDKGVHRNSNRTSVRSTNINVPMGDFRLAYPIPRGELDSNPNMKQNKGYGGSK